MNIHELFSKSPKKDAAQVVASTLHVRANAMYASVTVVSTVDVRNRYLVVMPRDVWIEFCKRQLAELETNSQEVA